LSTLHEMKQKPEPVSFFKVPDCLDTVLRLQSGLHGHRYAILYLIIHYLGSQKNPVRLSAKSICRNFHPLQVNAEYSQGSTHPCIAELSRLTGYSIHRSEEPANSIYPDGEGRNRVLYISVPEPEKYFLLPAHLMEDGFSKLFPMKMIRKQHRNLNISSSKLYVLLWLWRLSTRRKAISEKRPVLLDVKLCEVVREMEKVSKKKDVKARELLISLETADHLIKIRDMSKSRCVMELLSCSGIEVGSPLIHV